MYKRNLIFVLLLIFGIQSLKAQTTTMYNEEKLSIGLGVGCQYSLAGIYGKYFFSDYFGAVATGTYLPYGFLWNVGAEIRIPEILPKRISPYFNLMYGTNTYASLDAFVTTDPTIGFFEFISEKKGFVGLTIGAGIKWDVFNNNNSYFKLGFDYRFIPASYVQFVDQFNGTFATSHSTNALRFLPAVGFVFCLSRKAK